MGADVEIYQVDERVAPAGDPDRNLTHLEERLPDRADADVHAMPVEDADLAAGAARYAASCRIASTSSTSVSGRTDTRRRSSPMTLCSTSTTAMSR